MTEQKFLQEVQKVLDFFRSKGLKVNNPSGVKKEDRNSYGCKYHRFTCDVSTNHYFHYTKQAPVLTFSMDVTEYSNQMILNGIDGCGNWSLSKDEHEWQLENFTDEQMDRSEEKGSTLAKEIDKGLQDMGVVTPWDDDRAESSYEEALELKYQPYVLYL